MVLSQRNRNTIKIVGFILMIGLMVVLNDRQEAAKNKAGKNRHKEVVTDANRSGVTPGTATIPAKTEGALPLRLSSKPNSNFLLVVSNCQHFSHVVKYQLQQKNFLGFCTKISYNFITEFLATIRNKDYR
jgi:hypothetical protein